MGLCGVLFCRMIFAFKRFFDWLKCSRFLKLVLTFVAVAAIGFDSQLLLGGGNDLVGQLAFQSHGVLLLAGIVLGKILLTTFCYGSGAQGGIFLPMLVIGASAGAFCESLLSTLGLISPDFVPQFVICAMGGMLAAAMRTPILAILLVLEMTNSFSNIYAIGIVTLVAYLVAELLKEPPIYDSLLQAMSGQNNLESVQTFFQTKVPVVANYTDVQLQDLALPDGTLIVSIRRNGTYIVPLGDVKLEPGDELQVSCERGRLKAAKAYFQSN
jgi:voltage-gated chloride channel family protein